jgi:uncharacterized heparinase superfamily protein
MLVAEHDGYRRLAQPVVHRRRIEFDKPNTAWRITDEVEGDGEHLIELFFHPGVAPELDGDAVRLSAPRGDLWLFPPVGTSRRTEDGWISRAYGQREAATVLVYAVRAALPLRLVTRLILQPRGTSSAEARCSLVQTT